jgi:23S rRNA (uracil1939-C5)-methyltransferase/tRNA (uracil-5-)-methyltransferase
MPIEEQRRLKREHVRDVLERIGRFRCGDRSRDAELPTPPAVDAITVEATVGNDQTYNYRSKITPHYDKPRGGQVRAIGFTHVSGCFTVDVPECPIATPAINTRYGAYRQEVRASVAQRAELVRTAGARKQPLGATLLLRDDGRGHVVTDFKATMTIQVNGCSFTLQANDFFQVNLTVLPLLVNHVVSEASKCGARFLVDAYCGNGLFAICASKHFERCKGIELSPTSVRNAANNAAHNGLSNCAFVAGAAERIFEGVEFPAHETCLIIDPPRKGCSPEFLQQLLGFAPARVVYVACDPATQARDIRILVDSGMYLVDRVVPFDLFPQTRHIECVVSLSRRSETS